ncbi:MAG: hypothetical protein WC822_06725 [Candidatus Paceibacterota bacterium]
MSILYQIIVDSSDEVIAALIPTIVAALLGTGWWRSRASWLRALIAALAKGAVAQTEEDYVKPEKEVSGSDKLTGTQQRTAKAIASGTVVDALHEVGVTALKAAGPVISAAVDKAVADMKKTVPMETQKLFP